MTVGVILRYIPERSLTTGEPSGVGVAGWTARMLIVAGPGWRVPVSVSRLTR
jgi:hypothetical protein